MARTKTTTKDTTHRPKAPFERLGVNLTVERWRKLLTLRRLTALRSLSQYVDLLIDRAWDTYDAHHVKFIPRGFTPWELQRAQIAAHARFYSPWHVLARLFRGSMAGFVVGVYANALNRRWQRIERDYLRQLRRLRLLFPAPARV